LTPAILPPARLAEPPDRLPVTTLRLRHVGIAVNDLESAVALHERAFGQRVIAGPFVDRVQRVSVCFLGMGDDTEVSIELVAPAAEESPINRLLAKGIGTYHVCYEVDDIAAALAHMRAHGCVVVAEPVPAVAFEGRRIAWFYTPTRQLTELVEAPKPR
jgi:methylmalonyl-CoA/ethylmalonyl-CoA epimerase